MNGIKRILLGALLILASLNAYATNMVQQFYVPLPEDEVQTSIWPSIRGRRADEFGNLDCGYRRWHSHPLRPVGRRLRGRSVESDPKHHSGLGRVHQRRWRPCRQRRTARVYRALLQRVTQGHVIALRNTVNLPRDPSVLAYDGRDQIGASIAVVATRAEWATNPGTVLGGAAEMISVRDYGTDFKMPVGANLGTTPGDNGMFDYTGMLMVQPRMAPTAPIPMSVMLSRPCRPLIRAPITK